MECSHCMVNATPTGEHMSMSTFQGVLKFLRTMRSPLVMLSGGEPCEHPSLFGFIEALLNYNIKVLLLSNGMFLNDKAFTDRLLAKDVSIQITNDERYYPTTVPEISHPKVSYEHRIRSLAPFGRALTNKLTATQKAPGCFNLRSMIRSMRSFPDAFIGLRMRGRFCIPSVNVDGSIVAGESPSCTVIGNVEDLPETLTRNIINMTCSRCGLVNQLPHEYKAAIGESRIIVP